MGQETSETSGDWGELGWGEAGCHESHNKSKIRVCTRIPKRAAKNDDIIVEAVHGDNYWSCGLITHDVPLANEK